MEDEEEDEEDAGLRFTGETAAEEAEATAAAVERR